MFRVIPSTKDALIVFTATDSENKSVANITILKPDIDHGNSASTSWAECVANLNKLDLTVVTNKRRVKSKVTPRVKMLKGSKETDSGAPSSSVRGVPRRLTAYICWASSQGYYGGGFE